MLKKYSISLKEEDLALAYIELQEANELCGFGTILLKDLVDRYNLARKVGMSLHGYIFDLKE